jgi:dienelactone hydrolase
MSLSSHRARTLGHLIATIVTAGCAGSDRLTAAEPEPPVTAAACGGIGGTARVQSAAVPERGGATLEGRLFAPDAARQAGPCPLIVLLPGGGAGISSVEWAADRLAVSGYVVLVVRPASGGSTASYHAAAVSGIDFLQSAASPVRAETDTARVGVAGWSLGARSLSRTQAEDARVDALVAWDNLAVSESGDAGSPACTNLPGALRAPRVPALGQASETCAERGAESKKTAYEAWRAAGVPTVQVVFAGATHFNWSAQAPAAAHDLSHHYTRAWFDRWLKGDGTATTRLLARTVDGRPVEAVLSATFRSAAAVDGRTCGDLHRGC